MLCGSLCSYRIMAVKNIGIHYDSAYSLCCVTNPKLYTHRFRLNNCNLLRSGLRNWHSCTGGDWGDGVASMMISILCVLVKIEYQPAPCSHYIICCCCCCCAVAGWARVSARAPQLPVDTGQDRMCGPSLPVCYVTCDVKWGVTWPIPVKITAQQVAVSVICNKWGTVGKVDMIHTDCLNEFLNHCFNL